MASGGRRQRARSCPVQLQNAPGPRRGNHFRGEFGHLPADRAPSSPNPSA